MSTRYFIRFNPTKSFVQKLYRLVSTGLQYYGEQGGWHYSFSYNEKQKEFFSSELTQEVTEEEMNKYINNSKL